MNYLPKRSLALNALIFTALTAIYFIAGKLGLMLAFVNASATAVWPPTGIAIAALLILGARAWPAILVGAFLVNVTTAGSLLSSTTIAAGNTLEAVIGAYLVARFANGRHAFARAPDVFRFVMGAALVATSISATVGVSSLAVTGFVVWNDYWSVWLTWWLGDALGAIVVAPLIILWSEHLDIEWDAWRVLEASLLVTAIAVVTVIVFPWFSPPYRSGYPLQFLYIPLLIWASFRFSPREAVTAIFFLAGLAVWSTLRGFGPFVLPTTSPNESLLLLQSFMGTVSIATLGMSALVLERKRARAALQRANSNLEAQVQQRTQELSDALASHRLLSSQLIHTRDDEQRRISRRLHDEVGQDLVAVLLSLTGLLKATRHNFGPATLGAIREAIGITEACVDRVRTLAYVLHPPLLEEGGLRFAVQWYVDGLRKRAGLEITLQVDEGLPRLPSDLETAVFRIIQESLTNVHRHSGSSSAVVRIGVVSSELWIEVADAGRGMPEAVLRGEQGGVGITSMRERVRDFGGSLQLSSGEKGTTISARLPIRDSAERTATDRPEDSHGVSRTS